MEERAGIRHLGRPRARSVYGALPIIAASLECMGIWTFPAGESSASDTVKKSEDNAPSLSGTKKILVAYFSRSGNTCEIADQIHKIAGGDIFEIQAVKTYPDDYEEVKKVAMNELNSGFKPELKIKPGNLNSYDMVFIGYPIWWGTFPDPVKTFLSENDFSGKTIAPFCTHEGSGLGRSEQDIIKLCPKATVLNGIAIHGAFIDAANIKVSDWLRKINITQLE